MKNISIKLKKNREKLTNEKNNKFDIAIVCLLSLLFLGTIFTIFPLKYATNDDIYMMSVLSGRYTGVPSMNAIFILFPFTGILCFLYKICNFIDWYALSFILSKIGFYIIAMYKIVTKCNSKKLKLTSIIISFILLLYFEGIFIYSITFTEVLMFIMLCVLVIFLLSEDTKHEKIIMIVGMILSFIIRPKACLMLLPFMAIIGIYKCYGSKDKFKKYVVFAVQIVLILGTILISNIVVEKLFEWDEYNNYNNARSKYYDYYIDDINNLPETTRLELYEKSNIEEIDLLRIKNSYIRTR